MDSQIAAHSDQLSKGDRITFTGPTGYQVRGTVMAISFTTNSPVDSVIWREDLEGHVCTHLLNDPRIAKTPR